MLSDMSHTLKEKYCMIPLTQETCHKQIQRERQLIEDCQGWGEERMGNYCIMVTKPPCRMKEKFQIHCNDGCMTL